MFLFFPHEFGAKFIGMQEGQMIKHRTDKLYSCSFQMDTKDITHNQPEVFICMRKYSIQLTHKWHDCPKEKLVRNTS